MADLPEIAFVSLDRETGANTLILFHAHGDPFGERLGILDERTKGALARAMTVTAYKPKRKAILDILAPHGLTEQRLLIVGLGDVSTLSGRDWADIGGAVRGKLTAKTVHATARFEPGDGDRDAALGFALGFSLRGYKFKKYKTKKQDLDSPDVEEGQGAETAVRLTIASSEGPALGERFLYGSALVSGVFTARDLVNEPANILTPPAFAQKLRDFEEHGLEVNVLDETELARLGMNALLAVGQGSSQPTSAAIIQWNGLREAPADTAPIVFIGKGVCFDTGGISIKAGPGMEDMKGDMAGAAAVAGAMTALAARRAPVNAIGLVGLVENMPSGTAYRPGDVLTAASGHTIEVLNTDAEGRLVLADLIWYAQTHLAPKLMVTLATLTGAIMVALGKENAGLFSNDDELAENLTAAGLDTGETVWRLPLSKKYDKMIDSKIADMKNIGGRDAGSITAAQFVQRFVNKGMPWAHIDIAGTGMGSPSTDTNDGWASGFGVQLLDRLSGRFYEQS